MFDLLITGGQSIDATDHVVCPGFIDFQPIQGLVILAEPAPALSLVQTGWCQRGHN